MCSIGIEMHSGHGGTRAIAIVIILSHPAALGIISVNIPVVFKIAPLGAVKGIEEVITNAFVLKFIVRSMLMMLSPPATFGIVSLYIPLSVKLYHLNLPCSKNEEGLIA